MGSKKKKEAADKPIIQEGWLVGLYLAASSYGLFPIETLMALFAWHSADSLKILLSVGRPEDLGK
jgi:hypothetical protein